MLEILSLSLINQITLGPDYLIFLLFHHISWAISRLYIYVSPDQFYSICLDLENFVISRKPSGNLSRQF